MPTVFHLIIKNCPKTRLESLHNSSLIAFTHLFLWQ